MSTLSSCSRSLNYNQQPPPRRKVMVSTTGKCRGEWLSIDVVLLLRTRSVRIMKPVGLSRGRGIILIKDLSDLTYSQESVVQRYLERPLCLDGYKFDLRLYIVVTSFQPVIAAIHRRTSLLPRSLFFLLISWRRSSTGMGLLACPLRRTRLTRKPCRTSSFT